MDNVLASFFAPITLLLGGGLVALGFLSFLDLNFFKTPLRAKIAFAVGLAFLFATEAMFLTSSGAGRYLAGLRLDVTDCEFKVEEAFPLEREQARPCHLRQYQVLHGRARLRLEHRPSALRRGEARHQHFLLFAARAARPRDCRVSDEVRVRRGPSKKTTQNYRSDFFLSLYKSTNITGDSLSLFSAVSSMVNPLFK